MLSDLSLEWHAIVGAGGHKRCSQQSVGVNVSVCVENIWDLMDWRRIYSHAETQRSPARVLFGPTRISFQAAVGLAGGS